MEDTIKKFLALFTTALESKTFVKMSFGKPTQKSSDLRKVSVRIIEVKGETVLTFGYEHTTQTITKNFTFSEGTSVIKTLIGDQFKNINLFTTTKDHILMFSKKMIPKMQDKPATFTSTKTNPHNREKRRYISIENNIYLSELGVVTPQGAVAHKMQDKFKQINKYVEVLDNLIHASSLMKQKEISVADMGSGKGYLTFALYDYLTHSLNLNVKMTGIEMRDGLVHSCNSIAQKSNFNTLTFQSGSIQGKDLSAIDILIALHACDTATDDAIFKGIQAHASIIVTAPCCHKQIRRELQVTSILSEITKHGILKERQAEMITDTIRALLLEAHGYKTQIFEFIADAHTHKNVMITAVKKTKAFKPEIFLKKVTELKELFGIKTHYLEELLNK